MVNYVWSHLLHTAVLLYSIFDFCSFAEHVIFPFGTSYLINIYNLKFHWTTPFSLTHMLVQARMLVEAFNSHLQTDTIEYIHDWWNWLSIGLKIKVIILWVCYDWSSVFINMFKCHWTVILQISSIMSIFLECEEWRLIWLNKCEWTL